MNLLNTGFPVEPFAFVGAHTFARVRPIPALFLAGAEKSINYALENQNSSRREEDDLPLAKALLHRKIHSLIFKMLFSDEWLGEKYISMGEFSDENRNDEPWHGCGGIAEGKDRSGIVGCDVDRVD